MAGEEKLTQVEIRDNDNNIIKEIPLAPDLENIKYSDQKTAKAVIDELITEKIGRTDSAYRGKEGQFLQIVKQDENTYTIQPAAVDTAAFELAFKNSIPHKLADLKTEDSGYNNDKEWVQKTFVKNANFSNHIKDLLRTDFSLENDIQIQNEETIASTNTIQLMQGQISGINGLVNEINLKLPDIQTSINNIENLTDVTTINQQGDEETKENSVLYNTIHGHTKQIEKFDKFFNQVIGIESFINNYQTQTTSESFFTHLKNIEDKVNSYNEGLNRIIQTDQMQGDTDHPATVALGNPTTNKIAIWGSPSNKISMYTINRAENNGATTYEQYGMFMNPDSLAFSSIDLDTGKRTVVARYTPNTALPNQSITIPAGTCCNGLIAHGRKRIVFFIPTFENCIGRKVADWSKKITDSTIAIRSTLGYVDQYVLKGKEQSTTALKNISATLDCKKAGIKVTLDKGTEFTNATNNTVLSVYFVKDLTLTLE